MKLIMENWRKYLLNENEEEIRDAVIDAVKDEGGAADLDTIEDKVDIPPGFDLANFIKAMSGIGQSEHGDYIIDDEDSDGQVQVSKEDLQEGIKIFLQEKKKSSGKKDACYRKVKARYKVWPSAYASGALVKCRKVGASNWGNKSKKKK